MRYMGYFLIFFFNSCEILNRQENLIINSNILICDVISFFVRWKLGRMSFEVFQRTSSKVVWESPDSKKNRSFDWIYKSTASTYETKSFLYGNSKKIKTKWSVLLNNISFAQTEMRTLASLIVVFNMLSFGWKISIYPTGSTRFIGH